MKQQDIFAAAGAEQGTRRRQLPPPVPGLPAWRETHESSAASVPSTVAWRAQELGAQLWSLAAGLAEERLKADRSAMLQEKAAEFADRLTAELQQARASAAEHSPAQRQGRLEQLRRQA